MSETGCLKDGHFNNLEVDGLFFESRNSDLKQRLSRFVFFDDFIDPSYGGVDVGLAKYNGTEVGASAWAYAATPIVPTQGGWLSCTTAAAENDGAQIQLKTTPFKYEITEELYFETVLTTTDPTQTDIIVGLVNTTATVCEGSGRTDGIYFKIADGSAAISFVLEKNRSGETGKTETPTTADAGAGSATDTAINHITLAFHKPKGEDKFLVYVNNVLTNTVPNTNVPDDVFLTPTLALLNGNAGGHAAASHCDYIYVSSTITR